MQRSGSWLVGPGMRIEWPVDRTEDAIRRGQRGVFTIELGGGRVESAYDPSRDRVSAVHVTPPRCLDGMVYGRAFSRV